MSMKLYKEAYEQLIKEDLEALKSMPDNIERQHIENVLKDSINLYYPARKSANQWHDLEKNPKDLPKRDLPPFMTYSITVLCVVETDGLYMVSLFYDYDAKVWCHSNSGKDIDDDVIAWMELPEFKRE